MSRRAARIALALLACGRTLAQDPAAQAPTEAQVARLCATCESAREEQRIPGLTIAVRAPDGAEWSRGFGLADVENEVPATERTSYRLASIAKPLTAVVVMQLAAEKALDLDAPVQKWVPEFPQKAWDVSARHLLGHVAGVRHYRGDETLSNRHYDDVVAALAIFAQDPLEHEPGTRHTYTTYGYNLLGAVAQRAARRDFATLLHERVLVPAGMVETRLDDALAIVPHRAQGYRLRGDELVNASPVDTSNKVPGGGLCGTARDLVRFGVAMLEDRLVPRATRDLMWTPQKLNSGETVRYGYGFGVVTVDGAQVVGHGGSQPRVQTILRIWPADGVVVAVMCNLQGAKLEPIAAAAADALREAK